MGFISDFCFSQKYDPSLKVCPLSQRSCQTEPLGLFHLATILLTASMGKGKYTSNDLLAT